jgi:hypothetical protein
MEQSGGSRCNSDGKRQVLQYLHGEGAKYALINVKHLSAIPEYLIMCLKLGECRYYNWTIYCQIPIPTYGYMKT